MKTINEISFPFFLYDLTAWRNILKKRAAEGWMVEKIALG